MILELLIVAGLLVLANVVTRTMTPALLAAWGWATLITTVLLLLLGGCAASTTYIHPETHDVTVCDRRPASGFFVWIGYWPADLVLGAVSGAFYAVDAAQAGNQYADCKTAAEAAGFEKWSHASE